MGRSPPPPPLHKTDKLRQKKPPSSFVTKVNKLAYLEGERGFGLFLPLSPLFPCTYVNQSERGAAAAAAAEMKLPRWKGL